MQYFAGIPCPDDVSVPTEDADAWRWYPEHRWIYDKLAVALSQGLEAAPHGVMPPGFPVFSKPMVNLRGMGAGSRLIAIRGGYAAALTAGPFLDAPCSKASMSAPMSRWWTASRAGGGMRPARPRPAARSITGTIAPHRPGA